MRIPDWSQSLVIIFALGLAAAAAGQAQDPPAADDPKKAPERVDPEPPDRHRVPPRPAPREPVREMTEPAGERVEEVVEPGQEPGGERLRTAPDVAQADSMNVALEIESGGKSWGTIIVELNRDKAPRAVDNFLTYVDEGFYDGTIFHRILAGFIIQGGAYSRASRLKTDGLRDPIPCEGKNGLRNLRGTIAMARGSLPHSATSQFFINLDDTPGLDAGAKLGDEWGYCVFGRVVEGMDIVERIAGVKTRRNPRETGDMSPSQPIRAPKIKTARRTETESPSEDDVQEPAMEEKVIAEPAAAKKRTPEVAPPETPAPEAAPTDKPELKDAPATKPAAKAPSAKKPEPRAAPAKKPRQKSPPRRLTDRLETGPTRGRAHRCA